MGQCHHKGPSLTRDASPHSTWTQKVVKLGDGWQVSSRPTASLDCLLSKWSDSRSALPTDPHTSPPPSLTSGGNDELEPNTADFRVDHHLWGDWTFKRTSPVSATKLALSLRVGFISSHLTVDKLFPDNPRAITGPPKMSLLLEAKSMPALISNQGLSLFRTWMTFGWYITSNQQGKIFVQNLNRIVRKPNVMPRRFPYCTTNSIPIDLMFHENFSERKTFRKEGLGPLFVFFLLFILKKKIKIKMM